MVGKAQVKQARQGPGGHASSMEFQSSSVAELAGVKKEWHEQRVPS